MGETIFYLKYMPILDAGNIIDIISLIVNAGLGLWIALALQNNITNRRILKDHFIAEIKQIRDDYKSFFANIETMDAKQFIPWFKLMNIKINDLMFILNDKYKIPSDMLDAYKSNLNNLITNNPDYINQFRNGGPITFSSQSQTSILRFQQAHYSVFNILIALVNDK